MSPSSRDSFGTRPAPLRIHRDSHHIQKTTSSSSSSSSSNSSITSNQQRHHPVIIYTHSPKVIHTQARDFMALVQKLTGLSHSDEDDAGPHPSTGDPSKDNRTVADSSSSSENSSVSLPPPPVAAFDSLPPPNPFMHDMPIFTTSTSADFFCPPVSFYRYPEASVLSPPNPSNGPSLFMETMKPFPEY